jgi:hypothetical protein
MLFENRPNGPAFPLTIRSKIELIMEELND